MPTRWRHIRSFACPPCSHGTTAVSPYQENNLLLSGCLSCWQRLIVTITREKETAESRVTARFIWHLLFVLYITHLCHSSYWEDATGFARWAYALHLLHSEKRTLTNVQMMHYFWRYIFLLVPGYLMIVYVKLKDRKRSLSRKNDHNALWHYRNSHNVKFRVVAVFKQPRRGLDLVRIGWLGSIWLVYVGYVWLG